MQISIGEAEARWDDVVSRAEAGEEIVLTRDGEQVVRIVAVKQKQPEESATGGGATDGLPG
jgi:antitoxin (DNA-binding transcriptional repressor) of toxin-antitoxin stability system